jgi:acetylornithine/N-succinyldiaminopimelate aminotransferase
VIPPGDRALMPTYARYPVTLVRGEGVRVWDDRGARYLDLAGGIGALSIGHAHPRWVEAVSHAASTLGLASNLFHTAPQAAVAARLAELLPIPDARTFLCNSGAEAVEAALKLVRRRGLAGGRDRIVALEGSFHGRTVAALAATGQPAKRAPFEPLVDWFDFVPPNDPAALTATVGEHTAGVLLEPVMGEGGVVPLDPGYLDAARAVCDADGALLVVDEVQSGSGRCGAWLAISAAGIVPDVAVLAKGLGGGLPIGAVITRAELAFGPGEHGSTFGGGPVPSAAALATIDVIETEGLLANALEMGELLRAELARAVPGGTTVVIRGRGLLCGLELADGLSAHDVALAAIRRGVLVTEAGPRVVRMSPPLTIAAAEVEDGVGVVADALAEVAEVAA